MAGKKAKAAPPTAHQGPEIGVIQTGPAVLGKVCTFYSYKGGVGRTFALANIAAVMARWGYRVLCIDWDLEAPGLHLYFDDYLGPERLKVPGLLELIQRTAAGKTVDWRKYTVPVRLPDTKGRLDLMPAGRMDHSYVRRVQELDWDELYEAGELGLHLETLRLEWTTEYDLVLVDSRTGITDIGGICTVQLPDMLALFFTANMQSVQGAIDVAMRADERRQRLPFDRPRLLSLPVVSRFEGTTEVELAHKWLTILERELAELFIVWAPKSITARDLLNHTRVPYIAHWSFEERLPVVEESTSDPQSVGYAFETLAAMIANSLERVDLLVTNRASYVDIAVRHGQAPSGPDQFDFDAFLSYSRDQREFAQDLAGALVRTGLRVWTDFESLPKGEVWGSALAEGLNRSQDIIMLIGEEASSFQEEEYRQFLRRSLADETSSLILPIVMVAELDSIPPFLRDRQFVSGYGRSASEVAEQIAYRLYLARLEAARQSNDVDARVRTLSQVARLVFGWGRVEEAESLLHEAIPLVEDSSDLDAKAKILVQLAELTQAMGDFSKSKALLEQAVEASRASESSLLEAIALQDLGSLFQQMGDLPAAAELYHQVVSRFRQHADSGVKELVAAAFYMGGVALGALGRPEEAIATYNDLIKWQGGGVGAETRPVVAAAGIATGAELNNLGRRDEALSVLDEVMERFGSDPRPEVQRLMAHGLNAKGSVLAELGLTDNAIALYDEVASRYGDYSDGELKEQVATAMNAKASLLTTLGSFEAAHATYEDVARRFASAPEPELQELAARAAAERTNLARRLDQRAERTAERDDVEEVRRQLVWVKDGLGRLARETGELKEVIAAAESVLEPSRPSAKLAAAVTIADEVEPIAVKLEKLSGSWATQLDDVLALVPDLGIRLAGDQSVSGLAEELYRLTHETGDASRDIEFSLRESGRKIARLAKAQARLGALSRRILETADRVALGSKLQEAWDRAFSARGPRKEA